MKYAWFERIVLLLGGASILVTFALTYQSGLFLEEVIAQVLLFGVLAAAVHWGRRGGFVAAVAASIIYIVLRIPLVTADPALTGDVMLLILARVVTYGLVGIVGGELAMRMKYVLAGLESSSSIDEASGIFNDRAMARLLDAARGRFERYGEPYSIVLLEVDTSLTADFKPAKARAVLRGIAGYIRNDIRLVDEAGRLADGRFMVLLPHTPKPGAEVVAERLVHGMRAALTSGTDGVRARCVGASDEFEITDLQERLAAVTQPTSPA